MLSAFTRAPRAVALLAWLILLLLPPFPALARPHQHHRAYRKVHRHEAVRVVFVPVHQTRIREYFVVHRHDLPVYYYQDLDNLPPGLRRQLIVNGYLPRGLDRRIRPFPPRLDEVLGPPPSCCRRVIIGRDAYLIDRTSNLIVDIFANAIGR